MSTSTSANNQSAAATSTSTTSVLTPLVDANTAAALAIGTTNASEIDLNAPVVVAANKNVSCASGSTALDLSAGSGVTKTTTGVFTGGGSSNSFTNGVSIKPATNQLTLGATGHVTVISSTAPSAASQTITLSDAGSTDTFALVTLAQTFANKTLTAPIINGATSASGNFDLSGSSGTTKTTAGLTTVTGDLLMTAGKIMGLGAPQALSGAGAANVTTLITNFTSTGSAQAISLANGTQSGQLKVVHHTVDGGSGVLTPATAGNFATFTLTNVHDACLLSWNGSSWDIVLNVGGTVA